MRRQIAVLLTMAASSGCARSAPDAVGAAPVKVLAPSAYAHDAYEGASTKLPPGISYEELSARNPHATALCKEVFPCKPGDKVDNGPPFMCALAGIRNVAPEHIPGVRVESVVCPYRRLGEGGIFGVPDDGSRPLLTEEQLRARAAGHPRLRAILASGGLIDESFCPTTQQGDRVRFCVRSGHHCVLAPDESVACTDDDPERFLAACRRRYPGVRVTAGEWQGSPWATAAPSDAVLDGKIVGDPATWPGAQWRTDFPAEMILRAGGKRVRQLACAGPAGRAYGEGDYFVDGDADPVTASALLDRLDTDAMRAIVIGEILEGHGSIVLLDPLVRPESTRARCAAIWGPRRRGKLLVFTMESSPNAPRVTCTADLEAKTGSCVTRAPPTCD